MTLTRQQLDELRKAYRPEAVRILFVGESPPAGGTFFYLGNSNLARYTCEAFGRAYGEHVKVEQFPAAFRGRGCYLLDLCQTPINDKDKRERRAARRAGVDTLVEALSGLRPGRIVVVMKAIEQEVRRAANLASLAGIPLDALPFPAQGNQRRYVEDLVQLLARI